MTAEISDLVAEYRVRMNHLAGRLLYHERQFRRLIDMTGVAFDSFIEGFLGACVKIPTNLEGWVESDDQTIGGAVDRLRDARRALHDVRKAGAQAARRPPRHVPGPSGGRRVSRPRDPGRTGGS